jgi:hypothetical protein
VKGEDAEENGVELGVELGTEEEAEREMESKDVNEKNKGVNDVLIDLLDHSIMDWGFTHIGREELGEEPGGLDDLIEY